MISSWIAKAGPGSGGPCSCERCKRRSRHRNESMCGGGRDQSNAATVQGMPGPPGARMDKEAQGHQMPGWTRKDFLSGP